MSPPSGRLLALICVLLTVALLSLMARGVANTSRAYPQMRGQEKPQDWFVQDPDSLYHLRRIERVFREGLPVAERDPYLNYPTGAPIPWPPYYTLALYFMMAPFAPDDTEAVRPFVEQTAGALPMWFGVMTSILVALAGWYLAGAAGGLMSGGYHALTFASINYSNIGLADHHAWVSMLMVAMFMLLTGALARDALQDRARSLRWGIAAGLVAGLLMGSWVASLLYVLIFQTVLAWLLLQNTRKPIPGLPWFGLSYHLAAAVVLLPAVFTSPWKEEFPWMVVNLSWFHPMQLLLGAAVFVPLFFLPQRSKWFRGYPFVVGATLGGVGLLFVAGDFGPARGIKEGFEWVSRGNEFMSIIGESIPLIGDRAGGVRDLMSWLGYGVYFIPIAWGVAVWRAFFRAQTALLPFVIALPLLAIQALEQRRFADALSGPMAVIFGFGLVSIIAAQAPNWWRKCVAWVGDLPTWGRVFIGMLVVLGLQSQVLYTLGVKQYYSHEPERDPGLLRARGHRMLYEWIRHRGAPAEPESYSVLANWDEGHAIEWAADRPTVATNFGLYVGDGYYQPARFFMSEDLREAERILIERKTRYVIVNSVMPRHVHALIRVACPEKKSRYLERRANKEDTLLTPWFFTVGAMLTRDGVTRAREGQILAGPIPYLRMVHVSPYQDYDPNVRNAPQRNPSGWIWEYVPGARLEIAGVPGTELQIQIEIRFDNVGKTLVYQAAATAGDDGIARLRVPYATEGRNGNAVRAGRPTWTFGTRQGVLQIPSEAVTEGRTIALK